MNTSSRAWTFSVLALANLALLNASAFSQAVDAVDGPVINLVDGPVHVVPRFGLPDSVRASSGHSQQAASADANNSAAGLQFYTAKYTALGGKRLTFNIVGTDPSRGPNTTIIPTVLVPLKFIFPNKGNPVLDGSNVIAATQNSPIFQSADYTAKSVDLGNTQYGDALQRAEFWNLHGFSGDYHVLLGPPALAPTVTITVPPPNNGKNSGNAFPLAGGGFVGVLDPAFFNQVLNGLLPAYTAHELPIFVTDNVYLGTNGSINNCCILGFHDSQGPPVATAQTWIYAAYAEPGTLSDPLGGGFIDVVPLSHEVAEWLNDPFVGAFPSGINLIPPAVLPGQRGACIVNFETGDPLESRPFTFTKTTNSTVYHVQDEVVLPWYLHTTPSFSVNGWYTFQNTSAVIPLVVNSPATIAGSYTDTGQLSFAPINKTVMGNVVYVGRGCPGDTYLADPKGSIALIDRGACAVSLKIDRAVSAGATGTLIGLVAPGAAISFSYGGGSNFAPSLVITQPTSNSIKNALGSSAVNVTLSPDNAIPTPPSTLCGPG